MHVLCENIHILHGIVMCVCGLCMRCVGGPGLTNWQAAIQMPVTSGKRATSATAALRKLTLAPLSSLPV